MATKGKKNSKTRKEFIQWSRISLPLVKLHLDRENPRHNPVFNEDEAIAQLYEKEKVEALAKDIVEQRAMSPFDIIGVIAMPDNPGHFIAVEGNRRLCTLLLLNDPDRAPTSTAKELFRKLSKQVELPPTIEVVQFNSRADSKHWTDLRHLGPQEGQGLVAWSPTQKDRAAGGGANVLAVAILDRARDGQWLGDKKPPALTTLTRYLSNPLVRDALGLGNPRQLVFTHNHAEVDAALRQFLHDAMPTADGSMPKVNSRSNNAERAIYAREFRTRGFAPQTILPTPTAPSPTKPANKGNNGRNRPDPASRKCLVPTDFICNAEDRNLRLLFKEMRRTLIDDHEFANTYLLRAFVERVMALYLNRVDKGFHWKDDQALVTRCAAKLDPTNSNNKFKPIRTAASKEDASHSLHTLGAAIHTSLLMDRRALIKAWANWEYALTQMLDAISKP